MIIDIDEDGVLKRGATHSFHVNPSKARASIRPRLPSPASTRGIRCGRPFGAGCAAAHLPRDPPRGESVRLPARDSCGPQRGVRPRLPERRGRALRIKRNPFHPFSCFDTGDACRGGARADRAGQGRARSPVSSGIPVRRIRRRTTRSARPICSATSAIGCSDSFTEPRQRACAGLGDAPAAEPASEDPQMET